MIFADEVCADIVTVLGRTQNAQFKQQHCRSNRLTRKCREYGTKILHKFRITLYITNWQL